MPPRGNRGGGPPAGRGGGPSAGRGGGPSASRGGRALAQVPPHRGGGGGRGAAPRSALPPLQPAAPAAKAIGVPRPSFGNVGRAIKVKVNAISMEPPQLTIYHYDVGMDKNYKPKFNNQLIEILRNDNPTIFRAATSYDGRKNLYSVEDYPFGPSRSKSFDVVSDGKVFRIKLTQVRVVDTSVLDRHVHRQQSWDENVATALAALNVSVRMLPSLTHPFRTRTFYSTDRSKQIGQGLEVVRGFFQSIRPTFDRLIINVDISTGLMHRAGSLIELCLDFFGKLKDRGNAAVWLNAQELPDSERIKLQRSISGLTVEATSPSTGRRATYTVYKLTRRGAAQETFQQRDGTTTSVASYFASAGGALRFRDIICVQTKKGAILPLERCTVPPGQLSRAELTPDAQREVVQFSTQRPSERLEEIKKAMNLFAYGQSDYVRAFGLSIDEASLPLTINARVLDPPQLKYHGAVEKPRFGAWNMANKKFFKPSSISHWIVIAYVTDRVFSDSAMNSMTEDFMQNCRLVGITVHNTPMTMRSNPNGNIIGDIKRFGNEYRNARNAHPDFIVCLLPKFNNAGLYRMIKYWGDMESGVVTQCLIVDKVRNAKAQYWANVLLKVNAKLGGINSIPDAQSWIISDTANPTLIMGSDVIHPAPGSQSPSHASVIGSVDSDQSKYIARSNVQGSRQEMIADLQSMALDIIRNRIMYQKAMEGKANPQIKRIIFFRDGVSEGEFKRVLDLELPLLRAACAEANISPAITFIIVGKRHHIRFFPNSPEDGDRTGNVNAGTVIDRDITHPLEYDFYLQSHAGLLGTSRSAHYTVVHDDSKFSPDQMQVIAYTLCHTYARATRSVSIPAPVYYAHIVCSRAKTHYNPAAQEGSIISGGSATDSAAILEEHKRLYQKVHVNQGKRMYFM